MKPAISQLPTILGAFAAMLVAFVSLLSGTTPSSCAVKAGAAYLVFAGFGVVLRYALIEMATDMEAREAEEEAAHGASSSSHGNLDVIVPGTSVADLLAAHTDAAPAEQNAGEPATKAA